MLNRRQFVTATGVADARLAPRRIGTGDRDRQGAVRLSRRRHHRRGVAPRGREAARQRLREGRVGRQQGRRRRSTRGRGAQAQSGRRLGAAADAGRDDHAVSARLHQARVPDRGRDAGVHRLPARLRLRRRSGRARVGEEPEGLSRLGQGQPRRRPTTARPAPDRRRTFSARCSPRKPASTCAMCRTAARRPASRTCSAGRWRR